MQSRLVSSSGPCPNSGTKARSKVTQDTYKRNSSVASLDNYNYPSSKKITSVNNSNPMKASAQGLKQLSVPPLAVSVRPECLSDFFGQEKVVGEGSLLRKLLSTKKALNIILWGPPGTGKTTLARIISKESGLKMFELSAARHSLNDVRETAEKAVNHSKFVGAPCILFVDEIHRFSKSQQDFFLAPVENGEFIFISATTENPSFRVNNALISRCTVIVLEMLTPDNIKLILNRAVNLKYPNLSFSSGILDMISSMCNGDARVALNTLEAAINANPDELTEEHVSDVIKRSSVYYDRDTEEHYNIISALHKSMRGGDVDASIYWLWRMLSAGEDCLYIARRLVRFASEDIGIADSNALTLAVSTYSACQFVGMPECGVCLSHCVSYLALAPKSVKVYKAESLVKRFIEKNPPYPVPMNIRNAPTRLMQELGYGDGYIYPPNHTESMPESYSYLPEEMKSMRFYGVFEEIVEKKEDKLEGSKCKVLPRDEYCMK